MMMKKMMLLASAVAAIAAFAIPASASAAHFTDQGSPIPAAGIPETLTGTAEFKNANGGIHCETVHAVLHVTTNSAEVKEFLPTGCKTTGNLAAVCTVGTPLATQLPWVVDVTSTTSLNITGVDIDNPMTGINCPFAATGLTASGNGVTGSVTTEGVLGTVTLGGTLETAAGTVNVSGSLVPANPGTIWFE